MLLARDDLWKYIINPYAEGVKTASIQLDDSDANLIATQKEIEQNIRLDFSATRVRELEFIDVALMSAETLKSVNQELLAKLIDRLSAVKYYQPVFIEADSKPLSTIVLDVLAYEAFCVSMQRSLYLAINCLDGTIKDDELLMAYYIEDLCSTVYYSNDLLVLFSLLDFSSTIDDDSMQERRTSLKEQWISQYWHVIGSLCDGKEDRAAQIYDMLLEMTRKPIGKDYHSFPYQYSSWPNEQPMLSVRELNQLYTERQTRHQRNLDRWEAMGKDEKGFFLEVALMYIDAYGAPITAFTSSNFPDIAYTTQRGGAYVDLQRMAVDFEYLEALFTYS